MAVNRHEGGKFRLVTECKDPSLTRQADKDSADINKIIKRFEATGVLPEPVMAELFADVSAIGDYRETLETVRAVERVFALYPAGTRERFGNDALKFLDFLGDPANRAEAESLGIVPKGVGTEPPPLVSGGGVPTPAAPVGAGS